MASITPTTMSMNFTHMFDIKDLRGDLPKKKICKNSLFGFIVNNINLKKFSYILKLAQLEDFYNDPQANFTLFVPTDNSLKHIPDSFFIDMDDSTARHIIKSSTLDRKIISELLEDSPASYFYTKDSANRLFITNMNSKTFINNNINIIQKNIELSNGIIHIIDNLIYPEMMTELF